MILPNSSLRRIKILTKYYLLTSFHDKSRLFLIMAWPIIDLFIWGFTVTYLVQSQKPHSLYFSLILGTFIFWNLTIKAQQEISCQFMGDIFSRNLNNLLITPLKKGEFLASLIISSLFKLFLVISSLFIFAFIFYSFNLFQFNLWVFVFFSNLLIFGWSLGIIATAFILRFGYRMDFITWTLAFIIQPISCVFYPRSVLPSLFRLFSWLSPISYTFEGIREMILKEDLTSSNFYLSIFLNILYFVLSYLFFILMLKWAKRKGSLIRK